MKNIFRLIIVSLLAFFFLPPSAFAFYNDVSEENTHFEAIKTLYENEKLPDFELNRFRPGEEIKIGELYLFLIEFTDADIKLNEMHPDYFSTDFSLTKRQVIKKTFDALGIQPGYLNSNNTFPFIDIAPDSDFAAYAVAAYRLGILEEKPDYFMLAKKITRADLAYYLYKIHDFNPQIQLVQDLKKPPADVVTSLRDKEVEKILSSETVQGEEFAILADVYTTLNTDFLYKDELNNEQLIFGAIDGMLNELDDPYTVFQNPEKAKDFIESISGTYEGVGMSIDLINKNITIISPFKDSPAEKAGLKPGDIIIEVNNESVVGQTLEYTVGKIKGPAGTSVSITVLREKEEIKFEVERAAIFHASVQYKMLSNNIGYIELISFNETSYEEFKSAAEELLLEDPNGFIIDVRNNPGGIVQTAVNILSLFTDEQRTAVQFEYADGTKVPIKTNGNGLLNDYKIVLLINEGSASASEILAGALKDYGRATLVGTKTFGKGSVQNLVEYYNGAIFKYTISKWLTPKGSEINEVGIKPDILVKNTDSEIDEQLHAALREF